MRSERPTERPADLLWTEAMVGAQRHCCWRVGPPAEETESQPREAGSLRVDSAAVATTSRAHYAVPNVTDDQGWLMSVGLGILSACLFTAFCRGDSPEASAWWCHWPCSSACLFPRLCLIPKPLTFLLLSS